MFYTLPGATIHPEPRPSEASLPVAQKYDDVFPPILHEIGRIEGEDMMHSVTGGVSVVQMLDYAGWSGNTQIWWRNGAIGNELTLRFLMKEGGKLNVKAALTVSYDYATVSISLNGRQALESFDGYNPAVGVKVIDVGDFDITEGENVIKVKILGRSPVSTNYFFGLDYIDLSK
jgi:hypothetical protein